MIRYLCTAGTSISTSLGLDLRHLFNRNLSEWDALGVDVAAISQFVMERVTALSGEEFLRSSAEINSLMKMGMTADDCVVLISTDTVEGKLCAQLVANLLGTRQLCSKVDVEVINGLQARDGQRGGGLDACMGVHKLMVLSDELEWYFVQALAGKICEGSDQIEPLKFGSQQNPVSFGLSEGYSVQDIAHFYVARELGNKWVGDMLVNFGEPFRERLAIAFKEFGKDVRFEKQYVTEVMRQEVDLRQTFS